MAFKIAALDKLIEELGHLPGLGEKTAQRLAFHILKSHMDLAGRLSQSLLDVKMQVHACPECFSYTDKDICSQCADPMREKKLLCVVEDPADILRIEESVSFTGRYHVLQGVLSPLDGIGPDQIRLKELENRVDQYGVKEVILALDADLEGDATSLYINKLLKPKGVRVTRLAQGVPIGGNLDYVDHRTLGRALENRVEL
ncbi:MAG: recombination protein RecR [Oligoflexia bacterium]|nr:recombination protein RecR [Oligoflexia bacterium]